MIDSLVTDIGALIHRVSNESIVILGHDWGGPIALNTAALNEDRITATGTLSVPFNSRGPMPTLDLWKEIYKDRFFYQLYFQKEGIAEEEFLTLHVGPFNKENLGQCSSSWVGCLLYQNYIEETLRAK